MAKGLRSKTKRAFRAVKREDPASAYNIAEKLRMQRLGAALKQSALKPRALTDKEEWERQQEGYETESDAGVDATEAEGGQGSSKDIEGKEGMAVDSETAEGAEAAPEKKISTSGPRMSRREAYKSSKGFTVKQTPRTHFTAKGEKKRSACKPHRRR